MRKAYDEEAVDFDAWIDTLAPLLGFNIPAGERDAVLFNLRATLRHAAAVDSFPLDDEAEPAPVFSA